MPKRMTLEPLQRTAEQAREDLVLTFLHIGARTQNRQYIDVDRLHAALPFAFTVLLAHGHSPKNFGFFRDIVTRRFPALDEAITSLISLNLIRRGNSGDKKSTIILNPPQLMHTLYPQAITRMPEFDQAKSAIDIMWAAYDSNAVWESW